MKTIILKLFNGYRSYRKLPKIKISVTTMGGVMTTFDNKKLLSY